MSELFDKSAEGEGFKVASVSQLSLERRGVVVIDVREPDEYHGELGHLPEAKLVPLASVGQASGGWPKDSEYLMICRSGNRSGRAAAELVKLGFHKVINLQGGMNAVNAAGMAVSRS